MTEASATGPGMTAVRIGLVGFGRGGRYLSLRHAGGVVSHLRGDWALHGAPGPRFRVTGRTGTFAVEPDDGQSERLLSGQNPEDDSFGTVPQQRWGRLST